jgi:hypothetical protein
MANKQNLEKGKATQFKSGEEAAKAGAKGGIASGEAKRARKTLREELLMLLSDDVTDKNGNKIQAQAAMSAAILKQALTGNTKAFEIIRDTIGEKPVDKVEQINVDIEYQASVEYVQKLMEGME